VTLQGDNWTSKYLPLTVSLDDAAWPTTPPLVGQSIMARLMTTDSRMARLVVSNSRMI
jgi:hypothetical protein